MARTPEPGMLKARRLTRLPAPGEGGWMLVDTVDDPTETNQSPYLASGHA